MFDLEVEYYPTKQWGMGTLMAPNIIDEEYHMSGGTQGFKLSKEELENFILLENAPMKINGKLFWSCQVNVDQL